MEPDNFINDVDSAVREASDEKLADHARDAGYLGEVARRELSERGHEVTYSNVNGVQEASVILNGDPVAERVEAETSVEEETSADPEEAEGTDTLSGYGESAAEGE